MANAVEFEQTDSAQINTGDRLPDGLRAAIHRQQQLVKLAFYDFKDKQSRALTDILKLCKSDSSARQNVIDNYHELIHSAREEFDLYNAAVAESTRTGQPLPNHILSLHLVKFALQQDAKLQQHASINSAHSSVSTADKSQPSVSVSQ